ncbi:MAG: 1-deoxy-D-xylulose-5-phosphate reductoisomerase [Gammaproteobacteria bacterium]|nr:1-deoxy-D-xylulose-5-phosphate reductoisomerase [Gammaproteobacteria bacterium]
MAAQEKKEEGRQGVVVLGATGSIGVNTLSVIRLHPGRFQVIALSAHSQVARLYEQCLEFEPAYAVVADQEMAAKLQADLRRAGRRTEVLAGPEALDAVVEGEAVRTVVCGIVGAAGLLSAWAAVKAGKRVLFANKEPLVMSGHLLLAEAARSGAELLPLDSEHNAIFQCLPSSWSSLAGAGVRRILLTCSGGPFRNTPASEFAHVTPDQACAHPRWVMGRKISVDSATLMNKGLELIEACRLFQADPQQIEVVIHPQSVIHSLVEYVDGSVLAQLGNPDMRTPIAHALGFPVRIDAGVTSLDLPAIGRLEFEPPDEVRFPCLRLAREAAMAGGSAPTVLNAANEIAVAAFLGGEVAFSTIPEIIERVLSAIPVTAADSLEAIQAEDGRARHMAREWIAGRARQGVTAC